MNVNFKFSNLLWVLFFTHFIFAAVGPDPNNIHVSDIRKTGVYYKEGLFVGGDQLMNQAIVSDMRHFEHKGFERITIHLTGTHLGEQGAIPRPPYYQVSLDPILKTVNFTLYGTPITLQFNKETFMNQIKKKSSAFQSVSLFPVLEADRWSLSFQMKKAYKLEVFELKNPTRIVLDIQKD